MQYYTPATGPQFTAQDGTAFANGANITGLQFTDSTGTQYPYNWLFLATPDQLTALCITTTPDGEG